MKSGVGGRRQSKAFLRRAEWNQSDWNGNETTTRAWEVGDKRQRAGGKGRGRMLQIGKRVSTCWNCFVSKHTGPPPPPHPLFLFSHTLINCHLQMESNISSCSLSGISVTWSSSYQLGITAATIWRRPSGLSGRFTNYGVATLSKEQINEPFHLLCRLYPLCYSSQSSPRHPFVIDAYLCIIVG